MMPPEMVSASLEKDGLTVSITDGPGGLSAVVTNEAGEVLVEIASMEFEMAMNEVYAEVEHDYQEPETVLGYRDGGDWLFAPTSAVFGESAYVMSLTGVNGGFFCLVRSWATWKRCQSRPSLDPTLMGKKPSKPSKRPASPSKAVSGCCSEPSRARRKQSN
jgi:hypothetical protein